jgi:hypothetical protein
MFKALKVIFNKRLGWWEEYHLTWGDRIGLLIFGVFPIAYIAIDVLHYSMLSWQIYVFDIAVVIPVVTLYCQAKKVVRKIKLLKVCGLTLIVALGICGTTIWSYFDKSTAWTIEGIVVLALFVILWRLGAHLLDVKFYWYKKQLSQEEQERLSALWKKESKWKLLINSEVDDNKGKGILNG